MTLGSPNQSFISPTPSPTKAVNRSHDSNSPRWGMGTLTLPTTPSKGILDPPPLTLTLSLDSLSWSWAAVTQWCVLLGITPLPLAATAHGSQPSPPFSPAVSGTNLTAGWVLRALSIH